MLISHNSMVTAIYGTTSGDRFTIPSIPDQLIRVTYPVRALECKKKDCYLMFIWWYASVTVHEGVMCGTPEAHTKLSDCSSVTGCSSP